MWTDSLIVYIKSFPIPFHYTIKKSSSTYPLNPLPYIYKINIYNLYRATVPGSSKPRVWTGHRSANSRAISTVSSRWMMDDPIPSKPNHFIKMPFKQMTAMTAENQAKPQVNGIYWYVASSSVRR